VKSIRSRAPTSSPERLSLTWLASSVPNRQMSAGSDPVRPQHFDTADSFLAALRPSHPFWTPDPTLWVFRGHADSRWRLLPSVNRRADLALFAVDVSEIPGEGPYCEPELLLIDQLLTDFADALNRTGREVPVPPEDGKESLQWPPPQYLPWPALLPRPDRHRLIALAQHSGVPTQMLDWTRHALYAAYFAASESEMAPGASDLEVWALSTELDRPSPRPQLKAASLTDGREAMLHFSWPPRAGNANLHAQGGVFTYAAVWPYGAGALAAEEIVAAMAKANDLDGPLMHRLTLPRREAGDLLRLLSYEPVTGGTMFPGLDGVVREVRDRRRWRPKDIP
jgi:hypothetical protein